MRYNRNVSDEEVIRVCNPFDESYEIAIRIEQVNFVISNRPFIVDLHRYRLAWRTLPGEDSNEDSLSCPLSQRKWPRSTAAVDVNAAA